MSNENGVVSLRPTENETLEAADWLAKLDRGDLTAEEKAAFRRWLSEDPRNKDAIKDAASLWFGLNEPLSRLGAMDVRADLGVKDDLSPLAAFGGAFARLRTAAFAGVFFMVGVAVAAFVIINNQPSVVDGYYATTIGETKRVALEDGSDVHLNTNSIVEQSFSRKERAVRLVAGEAIFDVAHDEKRPFVVYAADGVIRAIGTRFAVRMADDRVSVTVTEGRVAFQQRTEAIAGDDDAAPSAAQKTFPVIVGKGEAAEISQNKTGTPPQAVSAGELAQRLSWAQGKLIFYDKDLQTVVDEVSRYTVVEILILDEALKTEKISGILEIGDVDMMLDGIEGALGVEADWISSNLVHLTAT